MVAIGICTLVLTATLVTRWLRQSAPADSTSTQQDVASASQDLAGARKDATSAQEDAQGGEVSVYTFGGHSYQLFVEGVTWSKAQKLCAEKGGHLVTIGSGEEQCFIEGLIEEEPCTMCWIGLYREGKDWHWVTGEQLAYENWAPDEPNGGKDGAECRGEIYGNFEKDASAEYKFGEWNDTLNEGGTSFWSISNMGYICEWDNNGADSDTVYD